AGAARRQLRLAGPAGVGPDRLRARNRRARRYVDLRSQCHAATDHAHAVRAAAALVRRAAAARSPRWIFDTRAHDERHLDADLAGARLGAAPAVGRARRRLSLLQTRARFRAVSERSE